jgi:hypothetical protein
MAPRKRQQAGRRLSQICPLGSPCTEDGHFLCPNETSDFSISSNYHYVSVSTLPSLFCSSTCRLVSNPATGLAAEVLDVQILCIDQGPTALIGPNCPWQTYPLSLMLNSGHPSCDKAVPFAGPGRLPAGEQI